MPYIMEKGRLYETDDADSGIRYNGLAFSPNALIISNMSFKPMPKDARCCYCNTRAFEGERRCIACGAPL